jgi:hypothetical protein
VDRAQVSDREWIHKDEDFRDSNSPDGCRTCQSVNREGKVLSQKALIRTLECKSHPQPYALTRLLDHPAEVEQVASPFR